MEAANEELVPVNLVSIVDIRPANEDEVFVEASLTSFILAASEELLEFRLLCKPSILVAAEELFVVTVLLIVVIDEFSDADVL